MRLRRLEIAILAITLAFAFFMGGFFTGRSSGSANIAAAQTEGSQNPVISTQSTPQSGNAAQQTPSESPASSPAASAQETTQPPAESTPSQGTGEPRETDGRININTASQGELTDLPGIGDVIAARIIEYRTQNGNFSSIEDIKNVSGIGDKKYDKMKDFITVG